MENYNLDIKKQPQNIQYIYSYIQTIDYVSCDYNTKLSAYRNLTEELKKVSVDDFVFIFGNLFFSDDKFVELCVDRWLRTAKLSEYQRKHPCIFFTQLIHAVLTRKIVFNIKASTIHFFDDLWLEIPFDILYAWHYLFLEIALDRFGDNSLWNRIDYSCDNISMNGFKKLDLLESSFDRKKLASSILFNILNKSHLVPTIYIVLQELNASSYLQSNALNRKIIFQLIIECEDFFEDKRHWRRKNQKQLL